MLSRMMLDIQVTFKEWRGTTLRIELIKITLRIELSTSLTRVLMDEIRIRLRTVGVHKYLKKEVVIFDIKQVVNFSFLNPCKHYDGIIY